MRTSHADDGATLKRSLSLPLLTFYGLGTILGAGIYALVGEVAGRAGALAPLSFLLAAILATFTALSYGELVGRFPRSAGEAVYVERGFNRRWLTTLVGLLVVTTGVVSAAAITNSFVGYLHEFIDIPRWLAIAGIVLLMGALAVWGISQSIITAMVITLIEIAGLLIILWAARDGWSELPGRAGEFVPNWSAATWTGLWLGAFLAFYAFIGFEDMVNVVEEVRDPLRVVPKAIILALASATVLYVLVALTAVLAMPADELAASSAPLADIYRASTGRNPALITLISLFAVINGALVQIIMASRVLYGMGRKAWLPAGLGRVNSVTRTPIVATAVVTGIVLILALAFPLVELAETTTFIILIVFGLVNVSLLRIKRREAAPEGATTYPLWVPAVGVCTCAALIGVKALDVVDVIG